MTTIINGSSPSITFSDSTTQTTAFNGQALSASPYTTSLGASTLVNNTGTSNTAIGNGALAANTTASNNTAVGYQAFYSNTVAGDGVAVGYQAGYSQTNPARNVAIGYQAMYSNVTGGNSVAIGWKAAYSATDLDQTVAIGNNALTANTTGDFNTALGASALAANTTASNNTAVGYQAGYSNTTGTYLTCVGYQAGYANTTNSEGTYVGYQAGLNTTGGSNTFIGRLAGSTVTSGANNTIIGEYNGNQGGLDIRTASNYIVLSDGAGNPRQIINNSGTLWVGCSSGPSSSVTGTEWNNTFKQWSNAVGSTVTSTHWSFINPNGGVGSIQTTNSTTAYNTSSDYRLKDDVQPMVGALDKVAQLKPCTYKWKIDGTSGEGFIAHELQEVVPQCVTGEKDAVDAEGKPVYQGIDTSFLVATLTAAIQELKAEFDAYKASHP